MFKWLSGLTLLLSTARLAKVFKVFFFFLKGKKKGDEGGKVLTVKKNCPCGRVLGLTEIHKI